MSSKALSKKPTYAEVVSRSVSPPLAPLAVSGARSKARDDSRPSQLTEKADIVDGLQGAATSEVAQSGKMEVSGGRRSARSDGVSVREQSRRDSKRGSASTTAKVVDPVTDSEGSSIEDSGKHMDKDDSMYRGRTLNSRVGTIDQPVSIIQTRRSKKASVPTVTTAVEDDSRLPRDDTSDIEVDPVFQARADHIPRSTTDDTRDDIDSREVPSPSKPGRLRRARRRDIVSDESDEEEDEEEGEGENEKEEDRSASLEPANINEYDISDPFIDDSAVPRGRRLERTPSVSPHRRRNRSPQWVDLEASEDSSHEPSPRKRGRRHSPIVISDTEDNADRRSRREPLESTVYNRQSPIIISDDEDDRTNRSRRDPPRPRSSKRQRSPSPSTSAKRPCLSAVVATQIPLPSGHPTTPSRDRRPVNSKGKEVSRRTPSPGPMDVSSPHAVSTPSRPPVRTFGSVLGRVGAASSSHASDLTPLSPSTTYVGDYEYRKPQDVPEKCEVTSIALQDPILRPYYKGLPPLYSCLFESWNDLDGPGMVSFSKWSDCYSHMCFDSCLNVLNFDHHGSYVNPARYSPLNVRIRTIAGAKSKYHLYTGDCRPAVCISSIFCKDSHVLAPPEKGLVQKSVTGLFHTQEWERTVGFMGTAFGHKNFRAQVSLDAMQFTTRAHFAKRDPVSPHKKSPMKMGSMFSNVRSPAVSSKASSVKTSYLDTFSLDHDADIPVYDCRSINVDLPSVLDRLHTLPRWTDEIPFGAFTVVAYTVAVFRVEKTNAWSISFNLQWAMILGIAEDRA